jgi:hypothetical protein
MIGNGMCGDQGEETAGCAQNCLRLKAKTWNKRY